jgi:CRP/FNR family transcriptional regulator, cyclic AMP receptor protein
MATHPDSVDSAEHHPTAANAPAPFAAGADYELDSLIALGAERSYRRAALILNEGETGDAMYFLLKGRVRVFGSSPTGKEITYGTIDAGAYFGEMALDGGSRSASVEALEPCVCSVVPNAQVLAFMKTHSDFAVELLHTLTDRARKATNAARDMALLDVYARLAQTLSRLAVADGEDSTVRSIKDPITHSELAAFVGASREMVSKLMKDLERGGYIQVDNRYIKLLKKLPARW